MSKQKPFLTGVFKLAGHTKTEEANKGSKLVMTFKNAYNYDEYIEILKLDSQVVRVLMKHDQKQEKAPFKDAVVDAIFGLKLSKTNTKNQQTVLTLDQEYKYTTLVECMKFNEFDVRMSIYIIQQNLDMETATDAEREAPL